MKCRTNSISQRGIQAGSLKNITERYDGYGNSIRKVMANKDKNPGLIGVVADIIKVDKEYEIAIETAFGRKYSKYCYG